MIEYNGIYFNGYNEINMKAEIYENFEFKNLNEFPNISSKFIIDISNNVDIMIMSDNYILINREMYSYNINKYDTGECIIYGIEKMNIISYFLSKLSLCSFKKPKYFIISDNKKTREYLKNV